MTEATADASLVEYLRPRREELVEFARALVATPSPNPPGDERAVAALVAEKLRELGVTRVETAGETEERPNLLAHVGGGGRTLILCGHLDTKPPGRPRRVATRSVRGGGRGRRAPRRGLRRHERRRRGDGLRDRRAREVRPRLRSGDARADGRRGGRLALRQPVARRDGPPRRRRGAARRAVRDRARVGGDRHRLSRRRALQGTRARDADALEHLRPAAVGERDRAHGAADRPHGS